MNFQLNSSVHALLRSANSEAARDQSPLARELPLNKTEKAIEAFIKAASKPRLRFEALVIPPDGKSYFGRKTTR